MLDQRNVRVVSISIALFRTRVYEKYSLEISQNSLSSLVYCPGPGSERQGE